MDSRVDLVPRTRYSDAILPFIGNGNVKILTGIRRCGKSSVMELFSERFGDCNVIYLPMDYASNRRLCKWESFLEYVESNLDADRDNVLFVDEVQNIEGWDLALRDMVSRGLCDIYITGSNSDLLSTEYSTHLGGRFDSVHMLPLAFSECIDFDRAYSLGTDVFQRFLELGGFPIIWNRDYDMRSAYQTVRDMVDVSIINDIVLRYDVKNLSLLMDILKTILSVIGRYVNANNVYNTLKSTGTKVGPDTVYSYIEYLEAANVLIRADVLDIRGRKVLPSKHKYYVSDLSIKHAMLGYRPEDTPAHMENIVFTELLSRGYDVFVGDCGGKEIDIVAENNGRRMYVQLCWRVDSHETFLRETGNLESVTDTFPKYLVLMEPGPYAGTTASGITVCGLKEFLLDILPAFDRC